MAVCSQHLDILSICTGGAGLDLGVELAIPAARTVCMVEREAFAIAHLVSAMQKGLLAPAAIWSDARTFNGRPWRGLVDGLIGGIPCQPHSLAGKRLGADDERDLWSTARRIIVQSGAWFVLIENVRGILSSGGAERVWRDLRRLGFAVEGGLFTASEVGAPHQRERIFILAVANNESRTWGDTIASSGRESRNVSVRGCGLGLGDAFSAGLEGGDGREVREQQQAFERSGEAFDHPISGRWREGWNNHRRDERHQSDATGKYSLEHTPGLGRGKGRPEPELRCGRDAADGAGGLSLGNAGSVGEFQPHDSDGAIAWQDAWTGAGGSGSGLFPPGPGNADAWAEIARFDPRSLPAISRHELFRHACRAEGIDPDGDPGSEEGMDPALRAAKLQAIAQSTLRRMADGMANRVDELRMLGNGVIPLESAYALRTLITRLAARGSAGAAQLVRMMEIAE